MEVISVLESVQKGMKDNIYNFCKDGKCSQCGNLLFQPFANEQKGSRCNSQIYP